MSMKFSYSSNLFLVWSTRIASKKRFQPFRQFDQAVVTLFWLEWSFQKLHLIHVCVSRYRYGCQWTDEMIRNFGGSLQPNCQLQVAVNCLKTSPKTMNAIFSYTKLKFEFVLELICVGVLRNIFLSKKLFLDIVGLCEAASIFVMLLWRSRSLNSKSSTTEGIRHHLVTWALIINQDENVTVHRQDTTKGQDFTLSTSCEGNFSETKAYEATMYEVGCILQFWLFDKHHKDFPIKTVPTPSRTHKLIEKASGVGWKAKKARQANALLLARVVFYCLRASSHRDNSAISTILNLLALKARLRIKLSSHPPSVSFHLNFNFIFFELL